jgi:RNA polymerase sigma factor (TIGR02999 family)
MEAADPPRSDATRSFSGSVDALFPVVYDELRQIAGAYMRRASPSHTLQPTALINEAYLRLAHMPQGKELSRPHFLALAALAMRQILANSARDRSRQKRGGDLGRITLHEDALVAEMRDEDLVALDDCLNRLAENDARKARVVEMRFFGGMSVEEIGAALDVGTATIKRDWAMARAWLVKELRKDPGT